MNPFRLTYKKREDKVTSLFIHILKKCDLFQDFLSEIKWDKQIDPFTDSTYRTGLQLHTIFPYPVKEALLLGISGTGTTEEFSLLPQKNKGGHPDAYVYDVINQRIVVIEVKVGNNLLSHEQLLSHKTKVPTIAVNDWSHGYMDWYKVRDFLISKLEMFKGKELQTYILVNFIGMLQEEVIAEYNEEYLIAYSGEYGLLVFNLLQHLKVCYKNYDYKLEHKTHNEVRLMIQGIRVATFILDKQRFIMNYGGKNGLKWRRNIESEYGVIYNQGDLYPHELCIPYINIDPVTLFLKPNKQCTHSLSLKDLIGETFKINKKLSKNIYPNFK